VVKAAATRRDIMSTHTTGNEVSDVMIDVVHDWHAAGRRGDLAGMLSGVMAPQDDSWLNDCSFELKPEKLFKGYNAFVITVHGDRVFFNSIVDFEVNEEEIIDNDSFFEKWYEGFNDELIRTRIVFGENKGDGVYVLTPLQYSLKDFSGLHSEIELGDCVFVYKTNEGRYIMSIDVDLFNEEELAEFAVKGELIKI
jgi:hypothetical protein